MHNGGRQDTTTPRPVFSETLRSAKPCALGSVVSGSKSRDNGSRSFGPF